MKTYIKRTHYLNKILPFVDKNLIKVIVGQRRVGKSNFLEQVMDSIREKKPKATIIFINKELYEFDEIRNDKDLWNYIKSKSHKSKKNYIFIDEIQDIFHFEKVLRSLQAEGNYDIYCTGSNAKLLSGELATYLSGRCVEIKIFGLSYPEFLDFHKLKNNTDTLFRYIRYGGLPYLINLAPHDEIIYDYLKNIYSAILFKDVVARHNIRNVAFLNNLVKYLAENTGNLVSAKKISDFLKSQRINISPNIVLNYISFIVDAFFVFKVQRAEVQGKKVFEIGEKYYFEDLGLRHSIVSYNQRDIAKILENLVYSHLAVSGYDITIGKMGNKEIDFVCTRNNEKLYIQVAYLIADAKVREREFDNLLAIKDNYPKIVVSMDETVPSNYKGIEHINIRDFLSKIK